jgi:hypothetical protein
VCCELGYGNHRLIQRQDGKGRVGSRVGRLGYVAKHDMDFDFLVFHGITNIYLSMQLLSLFVVSWFACRAVEWRWEVDR